MMAGTPRMDLRYRGKCPDCGVRKVRLPPVYPDPGDDIDLLVRDYDGFRMFMLEELAARFPERRRWTPADVEVALVEVLAAMLDQLSDMLDRVSSETSLETARRPASVRRLLNLIGYDAVARAGREAGLPDSMGIEDEDVETRHSRLSGFRGPLAGYGSDYQAIIDAVGDDAGDMIQSFIANPQAADGHTLDTVQNFLDAAPDFTERARRDALESYWLSHPYVMDRQRRAGPRHLHDQQRMVTLADYANRLAEHPLVERATAWEAWAGSWNCVNVAVIGRGNYRLDDPFVLNSAGIAEVDAFHQENGLPEVAWDDAGEIIIRHILRLLIDAWRMAGQQVLLCDAVPVGISMSISLHVADAYFQSEIRAAVAYALGTGVGGFFEPGRLQFAEDLHVSDIYERLMALDGVEAVCVNRFKRVGMQYPDTTYIGVIVLDGLEVAVCDQDAAHPERGYYRLILHGGRKG